MNFFAIKNKNDYCLYIYQDRFNKDIDYKNKILKITQNFDTLSSNKSDEIIIYPHINNITKIAKTYRNYKIKNKDFKFLKEKIKENKNVEKLLGAPQIYLASEIFFSIDDIKDGFIKAYKKEIENKKSILYTDEINSILKNIPNKLLQYQRIEIVNVINESLYKKAFKDFFTSFKQAQDIKKEIIKKLKPFIKNINYMGQGASLEILKRLKDLGMKNVWLCFHNFDMANISPEFVTQAVKDGFLIASYDSYKTIHQPNKEQWNTAKFQDKTLYEKGSIKNKNNEFITGYNKTGRELNPKFSLDEVKLRLDNFIKFGFNSWFIDTDAVAEVQDDYYHNSSKEEQILYRLKRIKFIKDKYHLVVGSEGGDDFANKELSFVQGIFNGIIPWWIFEELKDKKSIFFIGKYISRYGGIPEYFSRQIPISKEVKHLFFDENFNIPLYQLVYNDSVVSSNHWIFHNFKIKDEYEDIKLRELLYNTAPLYQLDRRILAKKGKIISDEYKEFANLKKELSLSEMISFDYVNDDPLIQKTTFSNKTQIIVNFKNKTYKIIKEN